MLGKALVMYVAMLFVKPGADPQAAQMKNKPNPNYPRSVAESVERHPRTAKPLPPPWETVLRKHLKGK